MKGLRLSILSLLLALAGCGFHLRGQGQPPLAVTSAYVDSAGAPILGSELNEQLRAQGVALSQARDQAELVIGLSGEQFDRRVLSVDATTGKAREFQIAYRARVRASRAGSEVLPSQPIDQLRDYVFDETAALGKYAEEAELRKEIVREAAQAALRMVRRALQR